MTTPMSGLRLVLVRTAAVVVPALLLTSLSVFWLSERGWLAGAWLLPSLALVLVALAVSRWVTVESAAVGVAIGWVAMLALGRLAEDETLDVLGGPVQIAAIAAVVVAVVVILAGRDRFRLEEVR
jgi:hypothetical protein